MKTCCVSPIARNYTVLTLPSYTRNVTICFLPVCDPLSRSLFVVNMIRFSYTSALVCSTAVCQQCLYPGYILTVFPSVNSGNIWHLTLAASAFWWIAPGQYQS